MHTYKLSFHCSSLCNSLSSKILFVWKVIRFSPGCNRFVSWRCCSLSNCTELGKLWNELVLGDIMWKFCHDVNSKSKCCCILVIAFNQFVHMNNKQILKVNVYIFSFCFCFVFCFVLFLFFCFFKPTLNLVSKISDDTYKNSIWPNL